MIELEDGIVRIKIGKACRAADWKGSDQKFWNSRKMVILGYFKVIMVGNIERYVPLPLFCQTKKQY